MSGTRRASAARSSTAASATPSSCWSSTLRENAASCALRVREPQVAVADDAQVALALQPRERAHAPHADLDRQRVEVLRLDDPHREPGGRAGDVPRVQHGDAASRRARAARAPCTDPSAPAPITTTSAPCPRSSHTSLHAKRLHQTRSRGRHIRHRWGRGAGGRRSRTGGTMSEQRTGGRAGRGATPGDLGRAGRGAEARARPQAAPRDDDRVRRDHRRRAVRRQRRGDQSRPARPRWSRTRSPACS